jgi:phosphate transport system substrate-binding protein
MLMMSLLAACGSSSTVVLQNKGSDTMVNLMQRLSEEYQVEHKDVIVAVTGGGSGTGIKSLIDKTTDMANASRPISEEEKELAKKNGVEAHETIVAYDGLAIYVHKDNPIQAISMEELRCIYGSDGTCKTWAELGVTLDCGDIVKVGRQNNSGTWEYFREEVLGKQGTFTNTMDQSGTQQVVDVVANSKCAIGYGGMGYHSDAVRFVCLTREKGGECAVPTVESVKSGKYNFSRPLYVYTNGAPQGPTKDFLDWVTGEKGQKIALDTGFVPLK